MFNIENLRLYYNALMPLIVTTFFKNLFIRPRHCSNRCCHYDIQLIGVLYPAGCFAKMIDVNLLLIIEGTASLAFFLLKF